MLVTNNLNFVKHANQVAVMEGGRIVTKGSYGDLARNDVDTAVLIGLKERAKHERQRAEEYGVGRQFDELYVPPDSSKTERQLEEDTMDGKHLDLSEKDEGLFIDNERIDDGKVALKIYWKYFGSIFTCWNLIPLLVLFITAEAVGWQFMIRVSYWLKGKYPDSTAINILASIAFGGLGTHLIKFLWYYNSGLINESHKFHDRMLQGVLQSQLKFFERNRSGTILNGFPTTLVS